MSDRDLTPEQYDALPRVVLGQKMPTFAGVLGIDRARRATAQRASQTLLEAIQRTAGKQ